MQRCAIWAASALAIGIGAAAGAPAAAAESGVDSQYVDDFIRPQDDLYRHLNGKWLERFQIPADKGIYTSFDGVADETELQLKGIIEALAPSAAGAAPSDADADAAKIADLYASFLNEAKLETLGIAPLKAQFDAIDAMKSKREIPALIAQLDQTDAATPYELDVEPDAQDSTRYAVLIEQSGLSMPDRDYYLKDDDKLWQARTRFLAHVERMLSMTGDASAARDAAAILELETAMARIQWTNVENRDPVNTYNKVTLSALPKLMPGYDWKRYIGGAGIEGKVDYVIVGQPSYLAALGKLMASTPLSAWKLYFKWQVLSAAAPYLSKAFVDEQFSFTGGALRGIPQNEPRWKRGIGLIDGAIGEALGKLYVERYFPPQNKLRIDELVRNLIEAYREDIQTLDWMSAETKKGAEEKLAKLATKIGYPERWRDYSGLKIARDDLLGNVARASQFEYRRNIDKLGKPIDRNEWGMTPQTVDAYYNPLMNEIVFPAAILQPPYFNVKADDAVNYGAIGAVIGHEISHAFDDEGSQFDADGNLRDWFTGEDHRKFALRTKALIEQYNRYEPVPGFHVNGELTLGENIADNAGLAIAFEAYEISLAGKRAPLIEGLSGEQRFYYGYVQVWRTKVRESQAVVLIKSDPHAPGAVRGTEPLRNQAGFYRAFGVKEGDRMYLPPDQRISIW